MSILNLLSSFPISLCSNSVCYHIIAPLYKDLFLESFVILVSLSYFSWESHTLCSRKHSHRAISLSAPHGRVPRASLILYTPIWISCHRVPTFHKYYKIGSHIHIQYKPVGPNLLLSYTFSSKSSWWSVISLQLSDFSSGGYTTLTQTFKILRVKPFLFYRVYCVDRSSLLCSVCLCFLPPLQYELS